VPHPEGVLIGTTDLFHDGQLTDPRASRAECAYLLAAVQTQFPTAHIAARDVVATFAGLRPILDHGAKTPSEASRDEGIWEEDGLLSVAGGKLTTWRITAKEAVDAALKRLPAERIAQAQPCATAGAPLVGRAPVDLATRLAATEGVAPAVAGALARRLRALSGLALDLARDPRELAPLADGTDLSLAEVRVHLRYGAVVHLDDLLVRRTRLGLWTPERAAELAPLLRGVCRDELGWSDTRFARELEATDTALAGFRPEALR